jgi:hypothetical protein
MAHDVTVVAPEHSVGRADFEFRVRENGESLGRLRVSKGALTWVPRNSTYGREISWREFDEFMRSDGQPESR